MKEIITNIEINATPEEVWRVLVDFPSHAKWNPFFARMEGEPTVGSTLVIKARNKDGGEGIGFTPTVLEADPARVLRWKGKFVVKGLFDGQHYFILESIADGRTRLTHGEQFNGILVPLMGKILTETEEGFNKLNSALASEVAARRSSPCSS